jgi:hypothetical protein
MKYSGKSNSEKEWYSDDTAPGWIPFGYTKEEVQYYRCELSSSSLFHSHKCGYAQFHRMKQHIVTGKGASKYRNENIKHMPTNVVTTQKKEAIPGRHLLNVPNEVIDIFVENEYPINWILGYDESEAWLILFPNYAEDNERLRDNTKKMSMVFNHLEKERIQNDDLYYDPKVLYSFKYLHIRSFKTNVTGETFSFDKILIWPELIETEPASDHRGLKLKLPRIFFRPVLSMIPMYDLKRPIFKCYYDDLGNVFYFRLPYENKPDETSLD